ncbi:hypothetical protein EV175_000054 [Coemansia sp. RSA 1933]|nr:hypothetical protein EV175_000054 [Coemansia sp. RSA 1933]
MKSKRRKIEHLPETVECQYNWSASDSMPNWSLHSLTADSSHKCMLSMPSPSSDQSALPNFNHSSNEETLAENFSLDIDVFPNVGSRQWDGQTVNIYQRRSSAVVGEDDGGPRRKILRLNGLSTSVIPERRAPGKENSHYDSSHLLRGLLFGMFEILLTEMSSGANNIKDIRMVPCEESDIQGNIPSASHPHSGSGLNSLTGSFWFNKNEVELMLDNSAQKCPRIVGHKPIILKTIRDWYNGYYIGRFRGK